MLSAVAFSNHLAIAIACLASTFLSHFSPFPIDTVLSLQIRRGLLQVDTASHERLPVRVRRSLMRYALAASP